MPEQKPIIKNPNRVLREKAREVPEAEIIGPKIRGLISSMKETLKNTPDGVGLAAPQVGESLQIFIVSEEAEIIDKTRIKSAEQNRAEDREKQKTSPKSDDASGKKPDWKYYVFINPVVKKFSRKKLEDAEGCLSVPGKFGRVRRCQKITVEAYDEFGKKFTRGASNFFARVIQHELDHLGGALFIDKVESYPDDK